MSKQYLEYLRHILQECIWLQSQFSDGTSMDAFLGDETLKRATVRSLEIIGEATKKIPADQKLRWPTIAWKNMAGMRDRLIHDYMGVNYLIVWDVVTNFIPDLTIQLERILEEE
jgi:uncharacterized protein with HEPN domain